MHRENASLVFTALALSAAATASAYQCRPQSVRLARIGAAGGLSACPLLSPCSGGLPWRRVLGDRHGGGERDRITVGSTESWPSLARHVSVRRRAVIGPPVSPARPPFQCF